MWSNYTWILLFLLFYVECEAENYCQFSGAVSLYPHSLFISVAGFGCYNRSNPSWLKNNQQLPADVRSMVYPEDGKVYQIPTVTNEDNQIVVFNYKLESTSNLVKGLYATPELFEKKWLLCAANADDCCANHLNDINSIPTPEYPCRAMWDGFSCYPRAKANTTVRVPCPPYTSTSDVTVCQLHSERYCLNDAWDPKTNYAKCAAAPIYRKRHNFHVIIISVAIAFMTPSVVIYFSFEKLRKAKTIIFHRNLIISILIKNVLVIISKEVVILDAVRLESNGVMEADGVGCKILAFIESASKNAIFTCMSFDALFLHKIFVRPFSGQWNMIIIYTVIVVASITPTLIWAILMGVYEKGHCWMADSESWFQWIPDGYKYAMLCINVFLLLDILRVLFLKLNQGGNKKQNMSALKATLILLPLFGVPLLITGQRDIVDMGDCVAGDIYTYTTYAIEAFQGILLCALFCYFNSDVQSEMKKLMRKLKIYLSERYGIFKSPSLRRRTTAMTVVGQN